MSVQKFPVSTLIGSSLWAVQLLCVTRCCRPPSTPETTTQTVSRPATAWWPDALTWHAEGVLPGHPDDELIAVADFAPRLVQDAVLQTVRATHSAVANRVFGLVPGSLPVRRLHDGILGLVHGGLGLATQGTGVVLKTLAEGTAGTRNPDVLQRYGAWRRMLAILNGVMGDLLERQGSPLAMPLAIRMANRDVDPDPGSLAQAFPHATGRVAVLVHGLAEDDESWSSTAEGRPARSDLPYLDLLRDAGVTPVVLRYNSGRHISDNAEDLDLLLEQLVTAWSPPVEELILMGHSMGGLVVLGAGEQAQMNDHMWPAMTTHVVTLGTPHGGAGLEKLANGVTWLLSSVPEMAAFGALLRRRSAGVKDLRHGYLRHTDWRDHDTDAWSSVAGDPAAGIDDAVHHLMAGTVGRSRQDWTSRAFGDVMVTWNSGVAVGHAWAATAQVVHLGSTNHFTLRAHPDVMDHLAGIIA